MRKYIINFQKKNKSSILITSHDLVEIEQLCSYLIILKEGKIIFKGNKQNLLKENKLSSLKEFFLNND